MVWTWNEPVRSAIASEARIHCAARANWAAWLHDTIVQQLANTSVSGRAPSPASVAAIASSSRPSPSSRRPACTSRAPRAASAHSSRSASPPARAAADACSASATPASASPRPPRSWARSSSAHPCSGSRPCSSTSRSSRAIHPQAAATLPRLSRWRK